MSSGRGARGGLSGFWRTLGCDDKAEDEEVEGFLLTVVDEDKIR